MSLTEKQRELRKRFIGASDVPRIMMGDSVRLVQEKLGALEPVEDELFEAKLVPYVDELDAVQEVRIGYKAEARILDEYERQFKPVKVERSAEVQPEEFPWLLVHPDQISYYDHPEIATVNTEAKSVGSYRRNLWGDGGDQIPHNVIWQVQTQMLCLGADITHVPVCFLDEQTLRQLYADEAGPIKISVYTIHASIKLQEYIIAKTEEVAGYIKRKELPPAQKLDDTLLLYPKSAEAMVEATIEVAQYCKALIEVKEQIKALGKQEERLKFHIQEFMREAAMLYHNGRLICTWRSDADSFYFDKERFKQEHPELFQQYSVPKTGARKLLPKEKGFS